MFSNQLKKYKFPFHRRAYLHIHETQRSKPKGNEIGDDGAVAAYNISCVVILHNKKRGDIMKYHFNSFCLAFKMAMVCLLVFLPHPPKLLRTFHFREENELK